MLFNSFHFLAIFLPLCLIFIFTISSKSKPAAIAVMALFSIYFYASWDLHYLPLFAISILINYYAGFFLTKLSCSFEEIRRYILIVTIVTDLMIISLFKYSSMATTSINYLLGTDIPLPEIVLPIGISFFTFTQIAFVVDAYKRQAVETNIINYILFVSYFPHLIAGPVIHHKDVMPQFNKNNSMRYNAKNISIGTTIFIIGLFKKIAIADTIAYSSTPVFEFVSSTGSIRTIDAWLGALSYTFQIYFDFSAYSDMAIGLSMMFGILLPINFNSPYKADSIISFWRCWHMTLSRFLRDYLYIPLGGNKKGSTRRYINLLITMTIGGLWHGAGWTYVLWGAAHGLLLSINHLWRRHASSGANKASGIPLLAQRWSGRALTFILVTLTWVIFRSNSVDDAAVMLSAMLAVNPGTAPAPIDTRATAAALIVLLAAVWVLPNVYEIFLKQRPALYIGFDKHRSLLNRKFAWRPSICWAISMGAAFVLSVIMLVRGQSEFLYFQF